MFALLAAAALLALLLPTTALADPATGPSFQGVDDSTTAFANPASAIGPNSMLEMAGLKAAIYNRSGGLITSAPMWTLFGGNQFSLTEPQPQVIWDPVTNRFYYELLDGTSLFQIGFSKSSNPRSIPGDFCNYSFDFGYNTTPDFPDFPKLGDTQHSLLIGVNRMELFGFGDGGALLQTGSDVDWMTKPAGAGTITTCPAQSTFKTGKAAGLTMGDGSMIDEPLPAVQTDPSTTGWVVTVTPSDQTQLPLFQVTENPDGTPNIPTNPTSGVGVDTFSGPPSSSEPNNGFINSGDEGTSDGHLSNAVTAIDPSQGNVMALWTAHTVSNGRPGRFSRAVVRWYEIDVNGASVLQNDVVNLGGTSAFNPSIAPDRAVNGTSAAFGTGMVMSFNSSSSSAGPDIQMVSKLGDLPFSSVVPVKTSNGPDQGFECSGGACLWGNAGASADPAANPNGTEGNVWLTNMWSKGGGSNTSASEWSTWSWEAIP
jgi:hypothetical protein